MIMILDKVNQEVMYYAGVTPQRDLFVNQGYHVFIYKLNGNFLFLGNNIY